MYIFENYKLGIDDNELTISTSEEHHLAAKMMAEQSRREISIISRALDPLVYNVPAFVDAVKQMLLSNRRARMRIIVFESQTIVRRGHLLLNLAENMPSYIEFRTPIRARYDFNESLFVADSTAYLYRNNAERFDGLLNFKDKRKCKVLLDVFEEMWERSTPDPNLRRLSL